MTDDLQLHDIEFSDLELQGGGGGGESAILHLNPKKYGPESDMSDEDDEHSGDEGSENGEEQYKRRGGSKFIGNDHHDYDDDDDDDDHDNDDERDDDDDDDEQAGGDGGDDYDQDEHNRIQIGGADDDDDDDDGGEDKAHVQDDGGGDSEDDAADIDNFKKFNQQLKMSYVADTHPEAESHNHDEVHAFATVVRDARGVIIDPLHKTIPILTKYEKTRILGMRTKQLNDGAEPYIKLPVTPVPIIDGYVIAQRELEEKKLPFIIRRPLPNGGTEYWYLQDLEIL
jgi:DNA-directed RNA polymerase subunit K/omega